MANRGRPPRPNEAHRLPIMLSEEDILFLQRIGYRCVREKQAPYGSERGGRGRKLSMTAIVRALIRVAKRLDVQLAGCSSEDELERRLVEAIERYGRD